MKSALLFSPNKESSSYQRAFEELTDEVRRIAVVLGKECRLLLQHSLKSDQMGIMVETDRKTFGGVGDTFEEAVTDIVGKMSEFRRKHGDARTTQEQAAGAASGRGARRKSSEGQRRHTVREGRRQGQG